MEAHSASNVKSFSQHSYSSHYFPHTPLQLSGFKALMDEHYDFSDACEWIYHKAKKTLTQSNLDSRLEEWTNIRNTKNQYSKQLRNFLKVSILNY